jgi:putative sterol carrier protein
MATTLEKMTADWRVAVGEDSGLGDYTVKYDLRGEGFIVIDRASVSNEDLPADITFSASLEVLEKLINGAMNPNSALLRGKLKISPMKLAPKIGPLLDPLMARIPVEAAEPTDGTDDSMSDDAIEPPLPAPAADMLMAELEMFDQESPESFANATGYDGFDVRPLGHVDKYTKGKWGGVMVRRVSDAPSAATWRMHEADVQYRYIIRGWAMVELEGQPPARLAAGSSLVQPKMNRHRLVEVSDDLIMIEVSSPANFLSTVWIWNDETQSYDATVVRSDHDLEAVSKL